jgi:hypothetical protein
MATALEHILDLHKRHQHNLLLQLRVCCLRMGVLHSRLLGCYSVRSTGSVTCTADRSLHAQTAVSSTCDAYVFLGLAKCCRLGCVLLWHLQCCL